MANNVQFPSKQAQGGVLSEVNQSITKGDFEGALTSLAQNKEQIGQKNLKELLKQLEEGVVQQAPEMESPRLKSIADRMMLVDPETAYRITRIQMSRHHVHRPLPERQNPNPNLAAPEEQIDRLLTGNSRDNVLEAHRLVLASNSLSEQYVRKVANRLYEKGLFDELVVICERFSNEDDQYEYLNRAVTGLLARSAAQRKEGDVQAAERDEGTAEKAADILKTPLLKERLQGKIASLQLIEIEKEQRCAELFPNVSPALPVVKPISAPRVVIPRLNLATPDVQSDVQDVLREDLGDDSPTTPKSERSVQSTRMPTVTPNELPERSLESFNEEDQ